MIIRSAHRSAPALFAVVGSALLYFGTQRVGLASHDTRVLDAAEADATLAGTPQPACHYVNQKTAAVCMTGELLNDCPQVSPCSVYSCRTDCTPIVADLASGPINHGYFNTNLDCATAGSTFNLVKCVSCWVGTSCCCSGAVITAGLPCSRVYDRFVYCADE